MHIREFAEYEVYAKGVIYIGLVAILKLHKIFYDVNCRRSVIVLASMLIYIYYSVSAYRRYEVLNTKILYRRRPRTSTTRNTDVFTTVKRGHKTF